MRFDLPTYESDYNAKMSMHRASFEARVAECVSAELLGGVLTAVMESRCFSARRNSMIGKERRPCENRAGTARAWFDSMWLDASSSNERPDPVLPCASAVRGARALHLAESSESVTCCI